MNGDNDNASDGHRRTARMLAVLWMLLCAAAGWDLVGRFAAVPAWWSIPSYVTVGAVIALGLVAVLLHVLLTRRAQRTPRLTALRMVALGVLLGAWLLRGHPEIPVDAPVVVAQLCAAAVLLIAQLRTS